MALPEDPQELQNPPSVLDALLCEEESVENDFGKNGIGDESQNCAESVKNHSFSPSVLLENDLFWDDDELVCLISKEKQTHLCCSDLTSDRSLMEVRKQAVRWILNVKAHYGFSALTVVLAVNYFDRFISSLQFQRDKPWMSQLTAVACLSLAAKVEEIDVPLLVDLQVEESKFVFEAKTIQRMELLVLSTLQWRMNPVTPNSFFSHFVRRIGLKNHLHWEFLWRCERLIVSVVPDSRFACYLPSVLAAATIFHVIDEIEPFNALKYHNQLMSVLKISVDSVNECFKLMLKISGSHGYIHKESHKRKKMSISSSPSGVIEASFSYDTSNDSWPLASSVSSSPAPRSKKQITGSADAIAFDKLCIC